MPLRRKVRFVSTRRKRARSSGKYVLRRSPLKRRRIGKRLSFRTTPTRKLTPMTQRPAGFIKAQHYCVLPYRYTSNAMNFGANFGWTFYDSNRVWRANSVYDPYPPALDYFNSSAAGHAYLSTVYNHYLVYKSTITVKVQQCQQAAGTTIYKPLEFILKLDDNNSIPANTLNAQYINNPLCVRKTLQFNANGDASITMRKSFYLRKHLGGKSTNDCASLCGANPIEQMYFLLLAGYPDHAGSLIGSPNYVVTAYIKYYVKYYELADLEGLTSLTQYQ